MKTCEGCAYFEKQSKIIIRKYSDKRLDEVCVGDSCLLHEWWLIREGQNTEACEDYITAEDLNVQNEESQLFERERRESECWGYECRGDERYHEELCGIRSNTKEGWM